MHLRLLFEDGRSRKRNCSCLNIVVNAFTLGAVPDLPREPVTSGPHKSQAFDLSG